MDIIYITGLRTDAIIGIHDWERQIRQTLVLDLELGSDITRAAASDQIAHALDYATVSERVLSLVQNSEYQLIETLAEEIARMLTRDMGVHWLRLRLSKPGAVAEAEDVGIIIERGQRR